MDNYAYRCFLESKRKFRLEADPHVNTPPPGDPRRAAWRLQELMSVLKKPLDDNELTLHWRVLKSGPLTNGRYAVKGACILEHIPTGLTERCELNVIAEDCSGPAITAAVTLMKRLTLEMVLGIATREIDEQLNTTHPSTPRSQPASTTPSEINSQKLDRKEEGEIKDWWLKQFKNPPTDLKERKEKYEEWASKITKQSCTSGALTTQQLQRISAYIATVEEN